MTVSESVQSSSEATRQRRRLSLVFLVIAAQILVPAAMMLGEPPSRFGWQMYSGLGEIPRITLIDEAGSSNRMPFDDVASNPRPEIDWGSYIPPHVCQDFDNARAVEISYSDREEKHEC